MNNTESTYRFRISESIEVLFFKDSEDFWKFHENTRYHHLISPRQAFWGETLIMIEFVDMQSIDFNAGLKLFKIVSRFAADFENALTVQKMSELAKNSYRSIIYYKHPQKIGVR